MPKKRNCHHQAQNGTRISNKIIDFGSETIFFFFFFVSLLNCQSIVII